jgi:hypothetical protein
VFIFLIFVEPHGREPAAFISREARRPQSAGAKNECGAAKGGNHKQEKDDDKEHHMRAALHGGLTPQMGAIESRNVNPLFRIFTISG